MNKSVWQVFNALERFEEVRQQWDQLNHSDANHILLDSRFIAALLRHFASNTVMLASKPGACMCLIQRNKIGLWSTFQPSQAPIGLIMGSHAQVGVPAIKELMASLPGYAIQISILQQDPAYCSLPRTSDSSDVRFMDYIQTSRLKIEGQFEDYWNKRSRNLKHNLDRQARRIGEEGQNIELCCEKDPPQMAGCVNEHGRMESEGWKGKEGTAISSDNTQGRFYRDLMATFASTDEARVYQLKLNGRVIASDLCLSRKGMLIVLKTAYDETIQGFSPALLMRKKIVERLFAEKEIEVIEFYGKVRTWHLQWTEDVRDMYHVDVFRAPIAATIRDWIKSARQHAEPPV